MADARADVGPDRFKSAREAYHALDELLPGVWGSRPSLRELPGQAGSTSVVPAHPHVPLATRPQLALPPAFDSRRTRRLWWANRTLTVIATIEAACIVVLIWRGRHLDVPAPEPARCLRFRLLAWRPRCHRRHLGDVGCSTRTRRHRLPRGPRHGRATRLAKLRHRLARGRVRGPGQGLRQRPAAWRGDAEAFWRAGRRPHRHARQQRDQLPAPQPVRIVAGRSGTAWQPGRSPGHRPGALRGSAPNLPRIL